MCLNPFADRILGLLSVERADAAGRDLRVGLADHIATRLAVRQAV